MPAKHAVLHVEDNDNTAYLFREATLETAEPVSLSRVCNGEEALAFLRKDAPYEHMERPDLVFLDLNMPKVDGWGVLAAVRQDTALCEIPIVVMSTSDAKADETRAHSLGACAYLVKPLNFEVLVQQLSDMFQSFLPPG